MHRAISIVVLLVGTLGASSNATSLRALIDGRPVHSASTAHPIALHPHRPVTLQVNVTNRGSQDVIVRTVRLEGRVMGLSFYQVDTSVDFTVHAASTETRNFPIDLHSLGTQASGLIPSTVTIFGPDHHQLATDSTLVDVRGSWHSIYNLFGIIVTVVTALVLARTLTDVARHRLPTNRLWRAAAFLPGGIGLALTIIFGLSAARVLAPRPSTWIPTLVACCLGLFAVGYLSPAPS